jgi:hypothetical protein
LSIALPARELRALVPTENEAVGIVAALFWCGNESVDGEWLLVDAADPVISRCTSIKAAQLLRACRNQRSLETLRCQVEQHWKPFFSAYSETAKLGYRTLRRELRDRLNHGTLGHPLSQEPILRCEHKAALRDLIAVLGPSATGRVLQRLFAYLLGFIGYRTITVNAIGVPDVEASNLISSASDVNLRASPDDLSRLIGYCREAGDADLAARLARHRRGTS